MAMTPNFAEHIATRGAPQGHDRTASIAAARYGHALRTAERACCCSARPVVVVVMPPSADRDHHTDLMLCAHHYRDAREALAASGASVFGHGGRLAMPEAAVPAAAR
jgi:hypothetical protein